MCFWIHGLVPAVWTTIPLVKTVEYILAPDRPTYPWQIKALSALMAVLVRYMDDGRVTLRAWLDGQELLIQLENLACQLPTALLVNLGDLLTERADHSFPYDAHLRLGLATHLIHEMGGHLEARQTEEMCTFTVTLPETRYDVIA